METPLRRACRLRREAKMTRKTLNKSSVIGWHCSQISRGPKNCKKGTQRGPNFWQKGDPKGTLFDVKGDLKFEFFIIVHKCLNSREIKLKFLQRWSIFTCRATSWAKGHFYFLIVKCSTNDTGSYYFAFFSLK